MGGHKKREHFTFVLSLTSANTGKISSVLFVLAIYFMLLLFSASLECALQPYGGVWRGVTER